MDFDSDSSLSDAPTPESEKAPLPVSSPPAAVEDEIEAIPKKPTRKASVQPTSDGSRRSSRVAASGSSRSNSPEKAVVPGKDVTSPPPSAKSSLKIKLNYTPMTDAPATIPEETVDDPTPKGKKRKPSTAKARADDEVREKAGTKKAKTSHPNRDEPVIENQEEPTPVEPVEPVKKSTIAKRKSIGKGQKADIKPKDDLLEGLFDDDNDEIEAQPIAGPSTAVDSEVVLGPHETAPVPTAKKTKKGSKAKRQIEEALPEAVEESIEVEDPSAVVGSRRRGKKADLEGQPRVVEAPTEEAEPPAKETKDPVLSFKKKGKKKAAQADEPTDQPDVIAETEEPKSDQPAVKEEEKVVPAKKNKTFAQAVTGSPAPPTETDRDPSAQPKKRPISAIPKIAKLNIASPLSTPQGGEKKPPLPGSLKKPPPPAQAPKKVVQAPSLLESTLATLQAAHAGASTPKKEEAKTTPKPAKTYVKGGWTDEWILTPAEQREVEESRAEREAAKARRMEWRKNPVNLQEAKDAYRLDSTRTRFIPPISGNSGLGIRTEGAPSKMVAALLAQAAANQTSGIA